MGKVLLLPYNMASGSARKLAQAIGIKRIYPDRNYKWKKGDVIINWGRIKPPGFPVPDKYAFLNDPETVFQSADKYQALNAMSWAGVSVPPYTNSKIRAMEWVKEGNPVVVRKTLHGHSGKGIELVSDPDTSFKSFPEAPLYTMYVKKRHEFRVHIIDGKYIDYTQKKLRVEVDKQPETYQVRNHKAGWVYCRQGVQWNPHVLVQAKAAIDALGLDFGAVDVGWNEKKELATVYEINSAPGLFGTTLYKYAAAFADMLDRPLLLDPPANLEADDPLEDFEEEPEIDY